MQKVLTLRLGSAMFGDIPSNAQRQFGHRSELACFVWKRSCCSVWMVIVFLSQVKNSMYIYI